MGASPKGVTATPEREQFSGSYTRYADRLRLKVKGPSGTSDTVKDAVTTTCLLTAVTGGRTAYSAYVKPADRKGVQRRGDVWAEAMLDLSLPNTIEYVSLADLVAATKRARIGAGPSQLVLTFPCDPDVCTADWTVTIDLDPGHGHLVRRCVYDTALRGGDRQVRTDEVVGFARTPAGQPFPNRIKYEARIGDAVVLSSEVTISSIKSPPSVPPETFRLRFRDRTPMTDHIRRTTYEVDADGNRISPETPLSDAAPGTDPAGHPLPPTADTEEEPARRLHWYVVGGSAALLLGVVGYKWRAGRPA
ncbi:MAG: hypothetical protein K2X87_18995 [Gemmataceae bacterium]|nr:hypothetical protein [Gemmataceae bacterium]